MNTLNKLVKVFYFALFSLLCLGIVMVIAMTTGVGVLTIGPIVMQRQITGGEAAQPPLQQIGSQRRQKSRQSRRRRRSWTRS